MSKHIDNLYCGLTDIKEHIITVEAAEKYINLSKQWSALIKKLPDEERLEVNYLHNLFNEFLNNCCKDHYTKGYRTGIDSTFKLMERFHFLPSDDDVAFDYNDK